MSDALAKKGASKRHPSLSRISGAQKSLLFLVSIDERVATKVLGAMTAFEVGELRRGSDDLEEIETGAIIDIYKDFIEEIRRGVPTSLRGSGAYLRRIAGKALGEGKIADVFDTGDLRTGPVADLAKLDVATVLPLLEREHPQTLAVIFSLMDPERASTLLQQFPGEQQSEILRRIATLKKIPVNVVREIERQFAAELEALGDIEQKDIDGVDAAAALLKRTDGEKADELIDELSLIDVDASEQIRKAMFTFENLIRVDARGMQALLKEVTTDQLVLALKTASEDLKEKVFGSVSSRAAATLRDELELMGPARLADVEKAQEDIVQTALQLEKDGRIAIAREGGGDYV
mgnify:CR=1 FL=1